MKNQLVIDDILNRKEEPSTLIELEPNKEEMPLSDFNLKNEKLAEVLLGKRESNKSNVKETTIDLRDTAVHSEYADNVFLENWKNVANYPSRLLEIHDNNVLLECLVDREEGTYEERIFRKELFSDLNIELGNLFYLRIFDRKNETKLQILDGKKLVDESDFPKINFKNLFSSSSLFK